MAAVNDTILSPLEILDDNGERVVMYTGNYLSPNYLHAIPVFTHLQASGFYGRMDFQYFIGEGYAIWFSQYKIAAQTHFHSRGDFPVLELSIPFKRQFNATWEGKISNAAKEKQLKLVWLPHINSYSTFEEEGDYATFDIHYTKEYLQRFAPEFPKLDIFLGKIERGEPCVLCANAQNLTPSMVNSINDILQCNLPGNIAGYFYQSAVLMSLLRILGVAEECAPPVSYTVHDIDCVHAARSLIAADASVKYSIAELAQKTGINESKLQRCFKSEFGTTLFDYGQSVRLQHAQQLLLNTQLSIQSIASQCGYPDHGNFTVAFKKRFGYTPQWFRAGRK